MKKSSLWIIGTTQTILIWGVPIAIMSRMLWWKLYFKLTCCMRQLAVLINPFSTWNQSFKHLIKGLLLQRLIGSHCILSSTLWQILSFYLVVCLSPSGKVIYCFQVSVALLGNQGDGIIPHWYEGQWWDLHRSIKCDQDDTCHVWAESLKAIALLYHYSFPSITRAACPLYGFLFQAQSQNKEDEEQSYLQLELEVVYLGKGLACCGRRREGNKYLWPSENT